MVKTKDLMELSISRATAWRKRLDGEYINDRFGDIPYDGIDFDGSDFRPQMPYDPEDQESYDKVLFTGRYQATQPTIIGAISKMISYVIATGFDYSIIPRRRKTSRGEEPVRDKELAQTASDYLLFQLEEMDWHGHQEELFLRLIRDGDVYRRFQQINRLEDGERASDTSEQLFDIIFYEPESIRNPSSADEVIRWSPTLQQNHPELFANSDELPEQVQRDLETNSPKFGTLGIVFDENDARIELGYWHQVSTGIFEFISAGDTQHLKRGVDRNDPRGIPLWFFGQCQVLNIGEVNRAMVDLCLCQSEHAAIYNHHDMTTPQQMEDLAFNRRQFREKKGRGRPASPRVMDAKGFRIDLPGIKLPAKDDVEIIQQQERFLGNMADMPEFMISGDPSGGNRSSNISAEGPFDRRVKREQSYLHKRDREILYRIVLFMSDSISKRYFGIDVEFPLAASRDRLKEGQLQIELVQNRIKSRKMVREEMKVDNDRAIQEIDDDPHPIVEPNAAGNNQGVPVMNPAAQG